MADRIDETAGESRDIGGRYTRDLLDAANHHGEQAGVTSLIWVEQSNRVQSGEMPGISGPPIYQPDQVNPLGRQFPASLEE
jgi:hypothetical protein